MNLWYPVFDSLVRPFKGILDEPDSISHWHLSLHVRIVQFNHPLSNSHFCIRWRLELRQLLEEAVVLALAANALWYFWTGSAEFGGRRIDPKGRRLYKGSLRSLMLIEGAGWWSFPECDCERIESIPSKLLKWPQCLPTIIFFLANLDCDISGRNSCYFRQNSENSVISVNIWEDLSNLDKTRK